MDWKIQFATNRDNDRIINVISQLRAGDGIGIEGIFAFTFKTLRIWKTF